VADSAGSAGAVNTGGGGGGGTSEPSSNGGAGGKGVIILRTPNTNKQATTLTVGTVTNTGGYYIYTFNDSGTIAWS
jgi:hypothetical protein